MRAVKYFSAQSVFILIAALAVIPFASATTTTTHKKHTAPAKLHSTGSSHHGSSHSSSAHSRSAHSRSTHTASTHSRHSKHGKHVVAKKSWKSQGQHGISSDRAREIQEALIQQHYLDGEPSGVWDAQTQEACRKFQADNGWQTKVLPDSRALIKLGLGPDHKDVLNPETAATSPYLPGGGVKSSESESIAPPVANSVQVPEQ